MVGAGMLHAPDEAKTRPLQGTVVAEGEGRLLDNGNLVPLAVHTGDRVLFGKFSGVEVELGAETLKILREDEVLAILYDDVEDGERGE